ncbi:MAG TPA: DUF2911 domain-containing protein, partial [Phaeodactylibacter sp.]|nr:DUF2911 domain-containing protein [Phaeodactylibacter sp.]
MIKKFLTLLVVLVTYQFCIAQISLPPSGDNQKSIVTQYIGSIAHVTVTYHSVDVTSPQGKSRKGKIWGKLVPWGMMPNNFGTAKEIPWRAGSNENTTIEFSHDMTVQGQPIKAGKYGFHIIPKENGPWTLIFSNNASSWGSFFYDQKEDALRVETTPVESAYHEWLDYEFTERLPASATLALKWENLSIPMKIELPNEKQLYVATLKDELRSSLGFSWTNVVAAANYCLQNDIDLEQGLKWADNAIKFGATNFTTLSTKAQLLSKLGKTSEADKLMDQALNHPSATAFQIHAYARSLIAAGKKDKAFEVFKFNFEKNNKAWPTHFGMARGYSALGQFDKAIEHAKLSLQQAPDQANKDYVAGLIKKLKKKE